MHTLRPVLTWHTHSASRIEDRLVISAGTTWLSATNHRGQRILSLRGGADLAALCHLIAKGLAPLEPAQPQAQVAIGATELAIDRSEGYRLFIDRGKAWATERGSLDDILAWFDPTHQASDHLYREMFNYEHRDGHWRLYHDGNLAFTLLPVDWPAFRTHLLNWLLLPDTERSYQAMLPSGTEFWLMHATETIWGQLSFRRPDKRFYELSLAKSTVARMLADIAKSMDSATDPGTAPGGRRT